MWNPQGYVTRVPVDDFVVGDLPMVCSRTGRPADGLVGIESNEGGFQPWWLFLLFLGPFGIVAIALLWSFARRPGRVGGAVPMTHEALADQNRIIGLANWAGIIPIAAFAAGVAALLAPGSFFAWLPFSNESVAVVLLLVALVGGFVVRGALSTVASRRRVTVRLDGSGRWVEIRNVHGDFARAVDRQVRARHAAALRDTARPDSPR
ncbi:MAG: hypothetical protein R2707_16145 [Acidimicrobiales bacterium]